MTPVSFFNSDNLDDRLDWWWLRNFFISFWNNLQRILGINGRIPLRSIACRTASFLFQSHTHHDQATSLTPITEDGESPIQEHTFLGFRIWQHAWSDLTSPFSAGLTRLAPFFVDEVARIFYSFERGILWTENERCLWLMWNRMR